MKVYIYKKNTKSCKRERVDIIENANVISETEKNFNIVTDSGELIKYNNKDFMISIYGY